MKYTLCILVLAVFSATLAADKKRNDSCATPDGRNGNCVSLNNCPVINTAIASRNETVLNFVKQSYCGSDDDILVCCETPGPVPSSKLDVNAVLGNKACGVIKEQPKIVGGQATEIGEFPWMVSIRYKNTKTGGGTSAFCAGTLINDEYVLTAHTCISNEPHEPVSVKLGEWDTKTDPDCQEQVANKYCADPVQIVGIREVIQYPLHNSKNQYNDIGLLRLDKKVSFTDFIQPVCLRHIEPDSEVATRMTVVGWGKTEKGSLSNVLRKVEVPGVQRDSCNLVYQKLASRPLGVHEFCAGGEQGKDACTGDAGGPAMSIYSHGENSLVWNQDGIISLGVGCGREGSPAVYTRVSDYLDWIANVISNSK